MPEGWVVPIDTPALPRRAIAVRGTGSIAVLVMPPDPSTPRPWFIIITKKYTW